MVNLISVLTTWRERAKILRDVRNRSADQSEQMRFKVKDELTYALSALESGDYTRAKTIWEKLLIEYPTDAYKSVLTLKVLIGLRRYDEAALAMQNGLRRAPGNSYFLSGLGEVAQSRGNHSEAIEIYAKLRKQFPGVAMGYIGAVQSLKTQGRAAEAEDMAVIAIRKFPSDIRGFLECARLAVQRQDWEEALRRWLTICEQFNYFGAYVGAAEALRQLGRLSEAENLVQRARDLTSTDPGPLSEYALLAEAKGDTAEALQRWRGLLWRFPLNMPVYIVVSDAFQRLGEGAAAEATLRNAVDRFPTEMRPMLELAKLLHYKCRQYPAAAEAWGLLRQAFPDFRESYTSGADALHQAGRRQDAEAVSEEYRARFRSP